MRTGRWPDCARTDRRGHAVRCRLGRAPLPAGLDRVARIVVNVAGAAGAALFAQASLRSYVETHRLIGALFVVEQAWFAVAFLVRRPARAVSRGPGSWLLAFGGTFGGVLFRPVGAHPGWGVAAGLALQLAGVAACIISLAALGRSFGFVAADRGVKTRGPYAVVRHPIYASYLLIQSGTCCRACQCGTSWSRRLPAAATSAGPWQKNGCLPDRRPTGHISGRPGGC
jgi:protein-S-isoprenylcysteine O-methyltransferase Ste14